MATPTKTDPRPLLGQAATTDEDAERDEALDDAAQGVSGTADETEDGTGEIDAIGHAAGLVVKDDKPFRSVVDEVERRDLHRWELDPASRAEDEDPRKTEDPDEDVAAK